jgi:hypothetical protein
MAASRVNTQILTSKLIACVPYYNIVLIAEDYKLILCETIVKKFLTYSVQLESCASLKIPQQKCKELKRYWQRI